MPRRSNRTTWLLRLERTTKNYGVYVDASDDGEDIPEYIGRVYVPRDGEEPPTLGTLVFAPRDN